MATKKKQSGGESRSKKVQQPAVGHEEPAVTRDWTFTYGLLVGTAFVVAVFVLVFVFPNPTVPQIWIMRTVQALGGAGFAMALTGKLTVTVRRGRNAIVAGGPIAVFVILFLWVPPAQQVVSGSNNNIVKDTDGDVHINVTNTTSSEPAASGHAP